MSRRLALLIGCSHCDDPSIARLETPDVDIEALAAVLSTEEIGGFDEVTSIVNESASVIRRSISEFFVKKSRDDLLLFYFSGHGIKDDRGRLYLVAKDTNPNLLNATAIASTFVTEEMDASRSRRIILVLDCCHSGAFTEGMKSIVGASAGIATSFEGNGYGKIVLTATDAIQYAWQGDRVSGQAEPSVFTRYLVEGLKTGQADADQDGQITVDELFHYIHDKILTERRKQTPQMSVYKLSGNILIAKNPHLAEGPEDLPVWLQQAAESTFVQARVDSVTELRRLLTGRNPHIMARTVLEQLCNDDSTRVRTAAQQALVQLPSTLIGRPDYQHESPRIVSSAPPQDGERKASIDEGHEHIPQRVSFQNLEELVVHADILAVRTRNSLAADTTLVDPSMRIKLEDLISELRSAIDVEDEEAIILAVNALENSAFKAGLGSLKVGRYSAVATSVQPALIIYVLDLSASMAQTMGDKTRIQVVEDALGAVLRRMVLLSTKGNAVAPRYRVGLIAYSDHVYDLLDGLKPIDEIAKLGVPNLTRTFGKTDTARAFLVVEKLLKSELHSLQEGPAPVVCHITDGVFTGASPLPIVQRITDMSVKDGQVLVENIFIADDPLMEPIGDITQWRGVRAKSDLRVNYARTLFEMSSIIPASYRTVMNEVYNIAPDARMLFPGMFPDLIELGVVMSTATRTY